MSARYPKSPQAFINYRVKDSALLADTIYRELSRELGDGAAFIDHRKLEPGEPYPANLESAVLGATVILALIGPNWLTVQGDFGIRRLDNPDDWVRREIEIALSAPIPVIPILSDGATMPPKAAFCTIAKLEPFADLQGLPLETRTWDAHFKHLVDVLVKNHGFRRGAKAPVSGGIFQIRPFACTVPPRGRAPFEGRDDLLKHLAEILESSTDGELVALEGPSGVGKSELAREYARRNLTQYPGGVFQISFRSGGAPADLESLGATILCQTPIAGSSLEDRCLSALFGLGPERFLLIYDDVQVPDNVERWLPPSGTAGHVIATSTMGTWDQRWRTIRVGFLTPGAARIVVEKIAGKELTSLYGDRLIEKAAGLPVQLAPSAAALARAAERGRSAEAMGLLSSDTRKSFDGPWAIFNSDERTLLAAALQFSLDRIPRESLQAALRDGGGWQEKRVNSALDRCQDLFVLEGANHLRLHGLWADYVRDHLNEIEPSHLEAIRKSISAQMNIAAKEFLSNLSLVKAKDLLLAFAVETESWIDKDGQPMFDVATAGQIATALLEVGRFEDARPWFERAVSEKEKGDIHGRVDHASLGSSLHQVGYCYSSQGRFEDARPWFERAVSEKEKGDIHGRVDHESLGSSLHQVGYCYSSQGRFEDARPWFERAVSEAEKGDIHGRVDHASLGSSLHQVGYCYSSQGRFEDARPWFERAVSEKEKGDIHGRVDHASLGSSLHQVGYCYSSQGRFEDARPWFERAVSEKEKGDIHGRVDHESLGSSRHLVGYCYSSQGRFEDARPWFERAVSEKEKGDIHGRVDHESLGSSRHLVGYCYSSQGRFEDARPWFERAVSEAEKGDIHGRVDHASLGRSLHQVGDCYSSQGRFEDARPWFERAVSEAEKGDIHGRVDHASLGRSLHQVGYCYSSQGRFEDARSWFERAVSEKEKGDIHGRVDHASLGSSLHLVGYCYASQGRFEDARPWFERAVSEAEKGDIHGRVNDKRMEVMRTSLTEIIKTLQSTKEFSR